MRDEGTLSAKPVCLTAVTLNTAVDCITIIPRCDLGEVNRSHELHMFPGGKGVNVAKAARLLGAPAIATGFVGAGPLGRLLRQDLDQRGIECEFIELPGDTRPTYVLYEIAAERETVINNPAAYSVRAWDYWALRTRLRQQADRSEFVVLSGSLPQGVPPAAYAQLARAVQQVGARVVLDSSGDAFRQGLEAAPFMAKPTVRELAELIGEPCDSDEQIWAGAQRLREYGVELVVVSHGAEGAWALHRERRYRVRTAPVTVRSALGSGDAMVAGLCAALWEGRGLSEALAWAAAAGTSSAMRYGGGECRLDEVRELAGRVVVEEQSA